MQSRKALATRQESYEKGKHMIRSGIRMLIPSKKSGEVLKIVGSVIELCRNDPGCLSCHIYEDLQEENILMFEQVWKSKEDLDLHLRTDEYRNLLLALELALKQPEIRFDTISSSAGFETIEKARGITK